MENDKTLPECRSATAPRQRPNFCRDGDWYSGLKTVDDSPHYYRRSRVDDIAEHCDHGEVKDWEYTSTLHKTLDVDRPKLERESWLSENYKVLQDDDECCRKEATDPLCRNGSPPCCRNYSPCCSPSRYLETETMPTTEWHANQRVVPANRARRFMTNNRSDLAYRADNVQKMCHVPSDGSWFTENFKVLDERKRRLAPRLDEWEAGNKLVPEENPLARERHFNKVSHPYTWADESSKTLPPAYTHKPNMYKYVIENTGWDSALYKTFDPAEQAPSKFSRRARIAYAANHDWAVDSKVLPAEEQHRHRKHFEIYGTGWDSGLKTLPPSLAQAHGSGGAARGARSMSGPSGYWDLDNRKTLPWAVQSTTSYAGEGNRHIMNKRHNDIVQIQKRLSQRDGRCVC